MRILFLGNHTVGVEALSEIGAAEEVVGVVAHPEDPEDGVRYRSVHDFAVERGWEVIRSTGKDDRLPRFARESRPDLIWITDYRYLIPREVITIPRLGAINLHPSLLPRYRGRAPINWAILKGETTLGLTAHIVDEGMDTGDIVGQESFELGEEQDIGDALEILYPLYRKLTRQVLSAFHSGTVPRRAQDHAQATEFPRRRPEDGRIDWSRPAREVLNLVRAVAAPYPGAFSTLGGARLMVWKARLGGPDAPAGRVPGMVLQAGSDDLLVQCGDGPLHILRWEWEPGAGRPGITCGSILG